MSVLTHVLQVEPIKYPSKVERVAFQTATLVKDVLKGLGYYGKWTIILTQHSKKRADVKFAVLRRHGTSILLRTKPGDNGSCWETLLNPPPGFVLESVFNDLRQVRSDGTVLRPVQKLPEEIVSIHVVKTPTSTTFRPIESKPIESKPIQTIEPVELQVNLPPEPAPPQSLYQLMNGLGGYTDNLIKDQTAILQGLTIICMGMNPSDCSMSIKHATNLLVQEMGLDKFVLSTDKYSDPTRVAAVILRGIKNKGYTAVYAWPQKKESRIKETNQGYVLTPLGRTAIEQLKKTLPASVVNRLFTSELPRGAENWLGWQRSDFKPTRVIKSSPLPTAPYPVPVEAKIEDISSLFDTYNKLKKSLEDIDLILADCRQKKEIAEIEIPTIEDKIRQLKSQIDIENQKIVKIREDAKKITSELSGYEAMRVLEYEDYERVKSKLKKLVN